MEYYDLQTSKLGRLPFPYDVTLTYNYTLLVHKIDSIQLNTTRYS